MTMITAAPTPATSRADRRPGLRRLAGALLIVAGLALIVATQWSISSLADDLALEIQVSAPLTLTDHNTSNVPFGTGPLATAKVSGPVDDLTRELRTQLRSEDFTLGGADPERWVRPRSDSYDATIWTLHPTEATTDFRAITIEATTQDEDGRFMFPFVALIAAALVLGGSALARPADTGRRLQRGFASIGVLAFTSVTTVAVQALHRAKTLIDQHVADHGPLGDDLYGLAYIGNEAEARLADQLCVVDGLYPFGAFTAVMPLALAAMAVLPLTWSRRGVQLVLVGTTIVVAVLIARYEPVGSMVVEILE